jgi:hypothetical protein
MDQPSHVRAEAGDGKRTPTQFETVGQAPMLRLGVSKTDEDSRPELVVFSPIERTA